MSLESISQTIKARAMDLTGLNARVVFDLGDDGAVTVDANAMPPAVSEGAEDADVTIRLSRENLEKLLTGDLNPTLAYTLGKLKIDGSVGVAMKLAAMLDD